ncbi:AMP-binding protein [Nocardioides cheoyonin]|uniref:AMP-binding protein n=1 Tax=Nocardioides cheoyonin TaxID=3156615 RepID=UPI0032B3B1BB
MLYRCRWSCGDHLSPYQEACDVAVQTFGDAVDDVASRCSSAPAIVDDDGHHSWAQLRDVADALARSFLALGVCRGDYLAGLLRNRARWVACCLAASKVGAVFVPLNTWYKPRELAWTLRHTGAVGLIAEPRFLGHDWVADLEEIEPTLRTAERGAIQGAELPDLRWLAWTEGAHGAGWSWDELLAIGHSVQDADRAARQAEAAGSDPLLVLYTSGSTGNPKGVVLAQGPLLENGRGIGDRRDVRPGDRVWLGSPFFYGLASANALPVVLTHDATLVVQDRFDEERALSLIEGEACRVFYGMSNMIRRIYEAPTYSRDRVASLERGSAGIEVPERRLLLVEMGVSGATNSYGSTELCGNSLMGEVDDPLELKLTTAGRPLPGFEAQVVDPDTLQPLGVGEVGLLRMRGHSAVGYLHDSEATAAAWDGAGWYSTGDLGSVDRENRFRWRSRLKEMVKTGGINVSPAEIELLLQGHPAVREAYVVGVPDASRGEVPVAFVVADDGVTEQELRGYVRSVAANFKVPAQVFLRRSDQIFRTASGKPGRPALKEEAMRLRAG